MIIKKYINAISNINLFSSFTKAELKEIFCSSKLYVREYKRDQIIHFKNELCHTLDIIISGQVSVQNIDANGNVLTINVFSDGDNIGANVIFASRNIYPMTIQSISDTVLLQLQKELVIELCRNSGFTVEMMRAISDRTITLTDKINAISLKTIRQCIIDFLKYEHHIQKSNVIKLRLSKKDLAERLGIQRSSLSRELNKMRKDGLLEFDSRTITVKNDSIIQ